MATVFQPAPGIGGSPCSTRRCRVGCWPFPDSAASAISVAAVTLVLGGNAQSPASPTSRGSGAGARLGSA
eukprot:6488657-Lingulodinium_polyedra.AAC.1